jgi:hypothetical protein
MATVTVNTPQAIRVGVNRQQGGTVQSTGQGITTLKAARDLTVSANASTGMVISYDADTHNFSVTNVSASSLTEIDAGFF